MNRSILVLTVIFMLSIAVTKCSKPQSYCYSKGDPHITTFDKKLYRFSKKCQYVLVRDKTANIEILQTTEACRGRFTCIVCITITWGSTTIVIKVGGVVTVNGATIPKIGSKKMKDATISPGKGTLRIELTKFEYDIGFVFRGRHIDVKINVYFGYGKRKISGLCGNYNNRGSDDSKKPKLWKTAKICVP